MNIDNPYIFATLIEAAGYCGEFGLGKEVYDKTIEKDLADKGVFNVMITLALYACSQTCLTEAYQQAVSQYPDFLHTGRCVAPIAYPPEGTGWFLRPN